VANAMRTTSLLLFSPHHNLRFFHVLTSLSRSLFIAFTSLFYYIYQSKTSIFFILSLYRSLLSYSHCYMSLSCFHEIHIYVHSYSMFQEKSITKNAGNIEQ
jgi:hypothetical protein